MGSLKIGDIVVRKSYGGDIYFKIMQINTSQEGKAVYTLKGVDLRLIADAAEEDLLRPALSSITSSSELYNKKVNTSIKRVMLRRRAQGTIIKKTVQKKPEESEFINKPGRILHIDGDEEYMGVCLRGYRQLGLEVVGKAIPEKYQPAEISGLLKKYRPDILVLTGHDSVIKGSINYKSIDSYRNSRYYAEAVRIARQYESSYDDLVIFAGACQSYFEAIIEAGANFASSPHRVLIHAMDPVFICERIAFTSITKYVSPEEALENTITGAKGIGGLQTRGAFREGTLKSPYA